MKILKAAGFAGLLVLSSFALAEEPAPASAAPAATSVIQVSATADQVVSVNSGNAAVDAIGNLAAKCAERAGAFKACDSAGGFKAMACRKVAEIRYKNVECPQL